MGVAFGKVGVATRGLFFLEMLTSKTFVKKTKKGNVLKVVREHYLRDDVHCGVSDCTLCKDCPDGPSLDQSPTSHSTLCQFPHFILPDTNICLHQIDFLEDPSISNVILTQVVLQEVRHLNPGVHKRLRDIVSNKARKFYVFSNEHHRETYVERREEESANDRNDRAIRTCCQWYNIHLGKGLGQPPRVILLTNDRENKRRASAAGIESYTVLEYVQSLTVSSHLLDRLALIADGDKNDDKRSSSHKKVFFPEHLALSVIQKGLKSGKYLQGAFRGSRENYLEGFVSVPSLDKWVLVQGLENMNRAIHDDIVAVELLPESSWTSPCGIMKENNDIEDTNEEGEGEKKEAEELPTLKTTDATLVQPTGKIVGVIKRNWRPYCGTLLPLHDMKGTHHTFVPAERRIPRIQLETRQGSALLGKRIVISIDAWPRSSRYPCGHFVRDLGPIGDKDTENEVLLLEHDVPHLPFSPAVLKDLPQLPWVVTDEEISKRLDLRDLFVCSVDPPGCTDIDDALHFRELDNGNVEVGVHIADVSHFIRPKTALDEEASNRGTTVYLADKRIDMVPELLSSNLCSLRSGEDRLAFSVIWEMTSGVQIVSTRFSKSIIQSRESLTYAEAQMRIDDKSLSDEVTLSLRGLNALAKILKERRLEAGALTLASPEIRFEIDSETHDPIDLINKELKETNSLVEEFMLLANVSVAKAIYESFPDCALLRRHPAPPTSNYDILLKAAQSKGFTLTVDSAKSLADSLESARIPGDEYFNTMLRIMATRCMMQALYFCSGTLPYDEYHHYGLATPIYTHFTSPIRRYSDVIVHRLLAVSIDADVTYPLLLEKHHTQQLSNHLNHRHKMAQYAQRSSISLHTHLFFKEKDKVEDGFVLLVRRNAIQVIIPAYGIEGSIYFDEYGLSGLAYDESRPSLTVGGTRFCLFDKVVVKIAIEKKDLQTSKLVLCLVSPVIGERNGLGGSSQEKKGKKNK